MVPFLFFDLRIQLSKDVFPILVRGYRHRGVSMLEKNTRPHHEQRSIGFEYYVISYVNVAFRLSE